MAALKDRKMLVEGVSYPWSLIVKVANVGQGGCPHWVVSKLSKGPDREGSVLTLCPAGILQHKAWLKGLMRVAE